MNERAADKEARCSCSSGSIFPPLKRSTRSGANIFETLHKVAVWDEGLAIVYKTQRRIQEQLPDHS